MSKGDSLRPTVAIQFLNYLLGTSSLSSLFCERSICHRVGMDLRTPEEASSCRSPKDQSQAIRPGSKCPYHLSHLQVPHTTIDTNNEDIDILVM